MILPTKHIPSSTSLLGIGATILNRLNTPRTVSNLWEEVRDNPDVGNFERFTLALSFLYSIGSIEFNKGLLTLAKQ